MEVVDALRGAALFGILVVHCGEWFAAEYLPQHLYLAQAAGPLNALVAGKVELLFVNKFYSFFSFLFGLSFALMLGRSREVPAAFRRRFLRRLAVLGAIGLLHYLHWRGDILAVYAVLGAVLPLFSRAPNAAVLGVAVVLALNLPAGLSRAFTPRQAPSARAERRPEAVLAAQQAQANYATLAHGTYAATVVANARALGDVLAWQLSSGRFCKTLGFLLLGLYAGRRQLFQRLEARQGQFWTFILGAALVLAGTKAAAALLTRAWGPEQLATGPVLAWFGLVAETRNFATTLLYIAGLTLLFQSRPGRWAAGPLARVGRTALTNYLLQTLMGTLLFFGYGLGLLGSVQLWAAVLLSVPLFLLQMGLSAYWLRHFQYGPVEWVWRSLALGRLQPWRLPNRPAAHFSAP